MKKSPLINKYGGIDYSDVQVKIEYIDDLWMIYVEIPVIKENFCIESCDLKEGIESLVVSSMEKIHWHLEEINKQ